MEIRTTAGLSKGTYKIPFDMRDPNTKKDKANAIRSVEKFIASKIKSK